MFTSFGNVATFSALENVSDKVSSLIISLRFCNIARHSITSKFMNTLTDKISTFF